MWLAIWFVMNMGAQPGVMPDTPRCFRHLARRLLNQTWNSQQIIILNENGFINFKFTVKSRFIFDFQSPQIDLLHFNSTNLYFRFRQFGHFGQRLALCHIGVSVLIKCLFQRFQLKSLRNDLIEQNITKHGTITTLKSISSITIIYYDVKKSHIYPRKVTYFIPRAKFGNSELGKRPNNSKNIINLISSEARTIAPFARHGIVIICIWRSLIVRVSTFIHILATRWFVRFGQRCRFFLWNKFGLTLERLNLVHLCRVVCMINHSVHGVCVCQIRWEWNSPDS